MDTLVKNLHHAVTIAIINHLLQVKIKINHEAEYSFNLFNNMKSKILMRFGVQC